MRLCFGKISKTTLAGAGLACAVSFASAAAFAQSGEPSILLSPAPILPYTDFGVGHELHARADYDSDYVIGTGGVGATVFRDVDEVVTLWLKGHAAIDIDDAENFYVGSFVPSYAVRFDPDLALRLHLAADVGFEAEEEDILAQFGGGLALEHTYDATINQTIIFGGNVYVPLDDYSDSGEYGQLDRAPRLGGDAYLRFGQDFNDTGLRLEVTLAAFGYFDGDETDELYGGLGTLGLHYWGGLPEGFVVSANVGPRWANAGRGDFNDDEDLDVIAGLQLNYAWGGQTQGTRTVVREQAVYPGRDCVQVRNAKGEIFYDCARPVVAGVGGKTKKGEPTRELLPAPAPVTETVTYIRPGHRPVEPIRNLGYQSPFAPLNHQPPSPPITDTTPNTTVLN